MNQQPTLPFDSIEDTHEFFQILSEAVAEAKKDLEGNIQREPAGAGSRRVDALRIAFYSVEKLEFHISRSRRILNDLRSLRRLLFEERGSAKPAAPAAQVKTTPAKMPSRRMRPALPPEVYVPRSPMAA